jgi:ADP-ribosylation factor protein 1
MPVLISVADSSDIRRIDEARDKLHELLDDELRDAILLVYANKRDLPDAIANRPWHVQGDCTATGEGLHAGMDWIGEQISKKSETRPFGN